MPIAAEFISAARALEAEITTAREKRYETLRIEPSLPERLDADWALLAPAMRKLFETATKAQAPILQSSFSRDGSEISLKFKDASAPRGTRYLILARRNPLDPRAPIDRVWVCEAGGEALEFSDVIEAVRALVNRLTAVWS